MVKIFDKIVRGEFSITSINVSSSIVALLLGMIELLVYIWILSGNMSNGYNTADINERKTIGPIKNHVY